LGTAEPTHAVTASKFSDTWPGAWIALGATEDGSEFSYETKLESITVAEFFDPIRWVTTERSGSFAFNLADFTLNTYRRMLNQGPAITITGATTTTMGSWNPPTPGTEVRSMLGWESLDNTVRLIMFQVINGGAIKTAFKKAPSFSVIPCQFNFEVPASGNPFRILTAGVARLGV
jgi:hypothetical protein